MNLFHTCVWLALVSLLAAIPAAAQTKLDGGDIIESLNGLEAAAPQISAASLRQAALDNIRNHRGDNPLNRPPLSAALNKLPQFTVEILFDFNSAAIRPQSYRTIGLMADALHHPVLLQYKLLIVGHTDAKGGRESNLNLSQKRADAIREALTTTFRVATARLEAVGLGEEQLRDAEHPEAGLNRRVQLITLGKVK